MTNPKWRMLLSLFAIFAVMAIAVACGDDDDNGDTGDQTPATTGTATGASPTSTPAPQAGGTLTVQYLDVQSWDPHFSSFSQDIGHHGFVWRGLYKLDKSNNPVAEMAAGDPTISSDQKTYTVKLKPDLKWSDGQPLTAKDFVAGIHRTCDPDNAGQYQYLLSNIVGCDAFYGANGNPDANPPVAGKSAAEKEALRNAIGVRAVDETTVEYKLVEPQPTTPMILSLWMTYPVPSHIVKTSGEAWPTDPTKLAFNGPFTLESYTAKSGATFARNDNYAGAHKAYLDKVEFKYIEENAQSNNAFRSGQIQMALADTANLKAVQSEFGDKLNSYPQARTTSLQMQMEKEPLNNEKVRLALARAIDRETLANNVLQGAVIPTTSWIPADVIGIDPKAFDDKIGFNVAEAKKLLADAGYADGKGFPELTILIRNDQAPKSTAEFLQAEFKKHLNINVKIEIVDAPTRSKRFSTEDFELFPGGWQQDYPDAENWIIGLFDKAGTLNHYNCFDPEIDSLIQKARYNSNNTERLSQYKQINELISTRACGSPAMYNNANHILIDPKVGGAKDFASPGQDRVISGDWTPEDWYIKS
ncbi:MAG: peptide ABC transporter substrate-binding protein [Dehalococcoidia bacterium]|nr:peptide ABC transporter substrate-binding protein [Dehalococcoidia bacterium]